MGYKRVCKFFIDASQNKKGEDTRLLKLMKLVYMSHGFFLALLDRSFIRKKDPFEAWTYGPVLVGLYDEYNELGHEDFLKEIDKSEPINDETERMILDAVYKRYADQESFELVALTHQFGSPWHQVYDGHYSNCIIPDKIIKSYYKEILRV